MSVGSVSSVVANPSRDGRFSMPRTCPHWQCVKTDVGYVMEWDAGVDTNKFARISKSFDRGRQETHHRES